MNSHNIYHREKWLYKQCVEEVKFVQQKLKTKVNESHPA